MIRTQSKQTEISTSRAVHTYFLHPVAMLTYTSVKTDVGLTQLRDFYVKYQSVQAISCVCIPHCLAVSIIDAMAFSYVNGAVSSVETRQ